MNIKSLSIFVCEKRKFYIKKLFQEKNKNMSNIGKETKTEKLHLWILGHCKVNCELSFMHVKILINQDIYHESSNFSFTIKIFFSNLS